MGFGIIMINLLHLSETKNRNSILTNGLLPTKVKNPYHLGYFTRHGIISGDKAIYTWLDSEKNEKFIRDMVYCKVWIHPRNDLIDGWSNNENEPDSIDFSKLSSDPIVKEQKIFDVFLLQVEEKESDIYNGQYSSDNKYNSAYNMDDKYAHDDKHLYIYDKPMKVSKIISQASYCFENGKIRIKILN